MIRHILMRDIRRATAEERLNSISRLRRRFHGLRGRIPGPLELETGVDSSGVDCVCDVVLCTAFESRAAPDADAQHPEHWRVRCELADIRIARHRIDFEVRTDHDHATRIE